MAYPSYPLWHCLQIFALNLPDCRLQFIHHVGCRRQLVSPLILPRSETDPDQTTTDLESGSNNKVPNPSDPDTMITYYLDAG